MSVALDEYDDYAHAERVRTEACRLAALVMAGRPNDAPAPLLWSLAVFFEAYIGRGSERTRRNFGPKKPTKLRVVRK